jgi:methionyl-tRNA formyltransferase
MRLVLVGDSGSVLSVELVRAAVNAIRGRGDLELVAVCDTARDRGRAHRRVAAELAAAALKPLFGSPHSPRRPLLLARGLPCPKVRAPGGDPNAPGLVALLHDALRPDAALWLGSTAIARGPLLASLGRSVNYHNGALPGFRGLQATAWSVYDECPTSGFSFHRMDEGVDTGPVLVAGAVPVPPGATGSRVEAAKTAAAIAALPSVLDAIVRGDPGLPQAGTASVRGTRDYRAAVAVGDPSTVTRADLELRLRAFGRVWLTLDRETVEVTAVRPSRPGRARAFVTADGSVLEASRLRFVPPGLYRAAERVRKGVRARRALG